MKQYIAASIVLAFTMLYILIAPKLNVGIDFYRATLWFLLAIILTLFGLNGVVDDILKKIRSG